MSSLSALYDGLGLEPADLTLVGTGMRLVADMTIEALWHIERADRLFFVTADVMSERWLQELNPSAERLPRYLPGRRRRETYALWVETVLAPVRQGQRTCAAVYGHPGLLVQFSRDAIRQARAEGYSARMLAGIGTDAALIADLLVDPGPTGLQSYTAGELLRRRPRFDTATPLVVWQLRVVNEPGPPTEIDRAGLHQLTGLLLSHYDAAHEVFVYEASKNPAIEPVVQAVALRSLPEVRFRASATLYVPGVGQALQPSLPAPLARASKPSQ